MREIKLRGKSIETGEMIYGSLINNMFFKSNTKEPVFYIVDPDQFDDYDSFEDIAHLAVEVDPDTVGQYTGLKDRNGKEIYEGDIVRVNRLTFESSGPLPDVMAVKYYGGMFQLFRGNESLMGLHLMYIADGEVIGNIYTNQEMLEG